jgi:hypothetical protein
VTRHNAAITVLCALCLASCGGSPKPATPPAPAKPAAPAISPEIEQAAEGALGSDAEVLAFGNLARDGRQQALAINRMKTTPSGIVPGVLLTRAVIIEKDGGAWKEVFRCDEHLKNSSGFLGGIPIAPVTGWRLQYEQHEDKGLVMYFTPLAQPAGGYVQTIGVRWNPKVKRYQSLDRNFEQFLTEVPSLEPIEMPLRK